MCAKPPGEKREPKAYPVYRRTARMGRPRGRPYGCVKHDRERAAYVGRKGFPLHIERRAESSFCNKDRKFERVLRFNNPVSVGGRRSTVRKRYLISCMREEGSAPAEMGHRSVGCIARSVLGDTGHSHAEHRQTWAPTMKELQGKRNQKGHRDKVSLPRSRTITRHPSLGRGDERG